jgi:seryl-tRNA synthetase
LAFAGEAALEPINAKIKELEAKRVECKPKDSHLVSINSKMGGARKKLAAADKGPEAAEAAVKKANEALQSARVKRVEVQASLADLESKQKQLASQIAQRSVEPKTNDLDAAFDSIKALWEAGGDPTSVNAAIGAVLTTVAASVVEVPGDVFTDCAEPATMDVDGQNDDSSVVFDKELHAQLVSALGEADAKRAAEVITAQRSKKAKV